MHLWAEQSIDYLPPKLRHPGSCPAEGDSPRQRRYPHRPIADSGCTNASDSRSLHAEKIDWVDQSSYLIILRGCAAVPVVMECCDIEHHRIDSERVAVQSGSAACGERTDQDPSSRSPNQEQSHFGTR